MTSSTVDMEGIPQSITIPVGQDIRGKIMSFSLQSGRAVIILHANGFISVATVSLPLTSRTLTYEGKFEIVSLAGFYGVTDSDGSRDRRPSLNVIFATPDSQFGGGHIAGRLIAASPVEVIVWSSLQPTFMPVNLGPGNAQENNGDTNGHGLDRPHAPGRIHTNQ